MNVARTANRQKPVLRKVVGPMSLLSITACSGGALDAGYDQPHCAGQISVIAAVLPTFAQGVTRITRSGTAPITRGTVARLSTDDIGNVWVVSAGDSASATNALWQALTSL